MSQEANKQVVDKYFKTGKRLIWLSGGLFVLFFVLLFLKEHNPVRYLFLVTQLALLLSHRLWGDRLSRNPEVKLLIEARLKNKNFWTA